MANNNSISERYNDFLNDVFEEVYRERSIFYENLNPSEKEKVFILLSDKKSTTSGNKNNIMKSPSGVSTKNEYLDSFSEQRFSKFLSEEYSNAVENEYKSIIDYQFKKEIMEVLLRYGVNDILGNRIREKIKGYILDLELIKFKGILKRI